MQMLSEIIFTFRKFSFPLYIYIEQMSFKNLEKKVPKVLRKYLEKYYCLEYIIGFF